MNQAEKNKVLERLAEIEMDNIKEFADTLELDKVDQLLEDIDRSGEVIFLASRASSVLADYSSYMFNKIGIKAVGYDVSDTKVIDTLRNVDRTSLVIAFAFPRYPKSAITTARYLKTRGFRVVGITEGEASPLKPFSDYWFDIKCDVYAFTDSYSAVMLLINYLVALYSICHEEDSMRQLKEFNEVAKQFEFYF